jgi:hypothetical protein
MCTVSFIPFRDKVFITSNRDESPRRSPASLPKAYLHNKGIMIFPKDGKSGGSWISVGNNGNAGVLLNGAFEKHQKLAAYSISRGVVFTKIMQSEHPLKKFLNMSLLTIEPFTVILWQSNSLFQCSWDGERKCYRALSSNRAYIWSSVTLYDDTIRKKRDHWFATWLNQHPYPDQNSIIQFHRFAGEGNKNEDLFMNRNGEVMTVSITGLEISNSKGIMNYTDFSAGESVVLETHFVL